jgi:hypothetical protein
LDRAVTSQYCAIGAIETASIPGSSFDAAHCFRLVLSEEGHSPSIIEWNDMPGQTQEGVLAMFSLVLSKFELEED